ncbi:TonB-dependent receptor [Sphingomonas sp. MMS24-J13]|uniref:TonB-dependent receptor n=1 Tax=Sphingomonas sp. MMS24-J13 TaxID=3238686 RepID=UPI00384B6D28
MNFQNAIFRARQVRAALLCGGALLAMTGPAQAARDAAGADAAAAAPAAADASGDGVGEIVVTARYRQESAQKVPIGITTLSGDTISQQGAFNLKQVVQQFPSLNIQGFSGRNQTITIRGLGTNAGGTNDGLEQGVGLYVDGVYRPRTGSVITDLVDIDNIQLLRGPQGTLFGKNTVAGAVDIKTRLPTFEPEVVGEISYGNYNAIRAYASVDAKVNDDVAVRVSYLHSSRDGLIYNTVYKQDWDNFNNNAVRFDALYKPTTNFKLRIIADYSKQTGDMGFQSVAAVLPTVLASGTEVRGFYRRSADVGYVPIAIDPFARKVDLNSGQYDKMPSWGVQAQADLDLGTFNLTSISAYRNWKWLPNYDGDQFGADIATQGIVTTRQQQVSQEFRITSPAGKTIEYTAGLYYFWQKANDDQLSLYATDASGWLTTPNTTSPTAAASALPEAALNGLGAYSKVIPQTWSYAAYSQATWNISPRFRLTGGLRFTYEHKTGSYNAFPTGTYASLDSFPLAQQAAIAARRNVLAPTGSYSASKNTNNLSWNTVAAYDLGDNIHAYASYSRGYKSPGINLVAQSNGVSIFVKPERVDDYEVGVKSRLLNGHLELNADLFWADDNNYQANFVNTTVTPNVQYITNVGKLRSRGVEVDARATPFDGLSLTLSGIYNDAYYVSYKRAQAPYLLTGSAAFVDLSGRPASGAPKWSVNGTAEYVRHAGPVDVYIGGDGSYRSGFYAAVNLDPFSYVPGYALFGLHAGVRAQGGRWDISGWVRNLTNKDYFNTKTVNSTYGIVTAALGEPRLYGLTLRTRF